MHTYGYTYTHKCMHMYTHKCMHSCAHTCVHTYPSWKHPAHQQALRVHRYYPDSSQIGRQIYTHFNVRDCTKYSIWRGEYSVRHHYFIDTTFRAYSVLFSKYFFENEPQALRFSSLLSSLSFALFFPVPVPLFSFLLFSPLLSPSTQSDQP